MSDTETQSCKSTPQDDECFRSQSPLSLAPPNKAGVFADTVQSTVDVEPGADAIQARREAQ